MSLSTEDLQRLCDVAMDAARAAAQIINGYDRSKLIVRTKAIDTSLAGQVVTEVDRQAQSVILAHLQQVSAQYDLAILAEESSDDAARQHKQAFWCVDPIDGTLPFVQGIAGYSVSIALVRQDGIPLIGVVLDPLSGDLYHAIDRQDAWKNDQPIKIPVLDTHQVLRLRTDFSFADHPWFNATQRGLDSIAQQLGMPGALIEYRTGAVLNACELLQTPQVCYFKYPRSTENGGSLWDYAATACLFNQAGGVASDIWGQPMQLNRPGSTFMNHRGIIYASDQRLASAIRALYIELSSDNQDASMPS